MTDHDQMLIRNIPFGAGIQTVDPNFSQWQLNAQDVIEILEHCLKGDHWDGKKWVERKGKPRLNDYGIQGIISEIQSRVNKIVIMSNLTERNVNDILWDLGDHLADELFLKKTEWGIDFSDLSPIHDMVMVITEATLKRAMQDGERRKIYEGVKTVEQKTVLEDKSKGGVFSWVPGIGR